MQKMFVIHYRMLVTFVKMIYAVEISEWLQLPQNTWKVLGIGWNLIEMLYDMFINGFEVAILKIPIVVCTSTHSA
jgi:hypothetical protein